MATGAGRQLAAQHAHSLEVWYAHVPGIKAAAPATVADARAMILLALEDEDPVFLFEHATLYPLEGDVDDGGLPLGRAAVRRAGTDVTLVTYGGSLWRALEAAERLAADGIEAEVVDLRSLRPLDIDTVLESVAKTHRLVLVDEGWRTGSLAGEVGMQVVELGFDLLDWPPQRVCSAEVPIPYAKHLEDAALPSVERIVAAATGTLA
jgi:pyruvate/2-oxoglutarate/acetoin dehydrogenase E1 component